MKTTITPNQIRPAAVNGQILATIDGAVTNAALVAGAGISITLSGGNIIISISSFAIVSFTGAQSVELGASVVNPSFAATYTMTPTSAQITNTEGIDSPLVLTTPFTAGTVTGTFSHSAVTTTDFVLEAAYDSTSQTSTQTIKWLPAIFGGVGAAGAGNTATASGATAVLDNSAVLARIALGAATVGELLGSFNPNGQAIYLFLTEDGHTFTDANTGFPIPFNAATPISFTNINGVVVSMFLYESTNVLFGTYDPKVAS